MTDQAGIHPNDYMNGFFSKPIGEKASLVGEIGAIFERQPTEAEARATWTISVSVDGDVEEWPKDQRLADVLAPNGGRWQYAGGAWEGETEESFVIVTQADTRTVNRLFGYLASVLTSQEWAHVENSKLGVRYVKLADFR